MKSFLSAAALIVVAFCILDTVRTAQGCDAENISSRGIATENPGAFDRIQAILDEPTELEFIETSLQDVLEYLKAKHDFEIQMDKAALEEAQIATDTPVTRNLKGISLRSALKLILREFDLGYIIRDEVLLVTTRDSARSYVTARVYQVCDLTSADDDSSDEVYETLIDVIRGTVEKTGTMHGDVTVSIKALPAAQSLVIAADENVHDQIEGLLVSIRAARDGQKGE